MEEDQQFCLRWNNHQSTLISVFDTLLENGTLVDCTLAAEGKFLKAHKVVLSACSPYFATLLSEQYDKHPIFILKDVKYQELRAMMDYMYRGEVNISQDQLAALLKAAESLQIKGLSDNRCGGGNQKPSSAEHKQLSVPGKLTGASGGYTLEQTKRARLGPSSVESQELSGSREGSSSPTSRRRKKVRRRSVDNVMADNHDNSNSSQSMQVNSSVPSANTQVGTITSVASIVPAAVSSLATSANLQAANITKKTDSLTKLGNTDAITTGADNEHADDNADKSAGTVSKKEQNHHKQRGATSSKIIVNESGKETEIVIEPKSEYDDGNDETVEDLTLDDEDMGLEDLDHTAGPSHGGEGSSQGYAQWQVDRSQDEVFMAAQEAQQRDPQGATNEYWTIVETVPYTSAQTTQTTTTTTSDASNLIHAATVVVEIPAESVGLTGSTIQYTIPKTEHVLTTKGTQATLPRTFTLEQLPQLPACTEIKPIQRLTTLQTVPTVMKQEPVASQIQGEDDEEEDIDTSTLIKLKAKPDEVEAEQPVDDGTKQIQITSKKTNRSSDSTQGAFVCNVCGKSYKIKGSLKRHKNYECGVIPGLSCKYCPHKSKYKSDLRKHIVQKHAHLDPDISNTSIVV